MENTKLRAYAFASFRLDVLKGNLWKDKELVNLPPKVFAVLCLLVERQGDTVSKTALMSAIWPESYVGESSLTQSVFLLRKALGKTGSGDEYVETQSKRGYRIAVPVRVLSESELATELQVTPQEIEPLSVIEPPAPKSWINWRPSLVWLLPTIALLFLGGAATLAPSFRALFLKPTVLRFRRLTNDGAYKERLISLLSDGARVYFTEDVDATSYLAEVSAEGGETIRRSGPNPNQTAQSFSPRRREILFGSLWEGSPEQPFMAMSLPDGALHSLGGLTGHSASWSSDGNRVAFARGMSLYTAQADGTKVEEIAHMAEAPYWPRWSPDGEQIRFSLQPSSRSVTLWEVGAHGENLHALFSDQAWATQACCGDWSPDGRYYVFVVQESQRSSLWLARDSRKWWRDIPPLRLADGPVDYWRAPLIAPDGQHIFVLGEQARGNLVKYDAQLNRFQPYLDGISTDTISFSRDGQWMAYTLFPEGTLWRSRVDGSERLRLTDVPGPARFPQWSPDGSQIVYIKAAADNVWKIHKVSANGGRSEILVPDTSNQGVATWSPDGKRIAFGQLVTFGVGPRTEQIRILELGSGKISALPDSSGLWTARWSPNGDYLAAVTTDNRRLLLYDFDHKKWTRLAEMGINDVVWSRDGNAIFFDSTNDASIYRVDLKSRQVSRFASLEGFRRTGFYGLSLNIAPDNTPVLLREAGIHELYSLDVRLP